MSPPPGGPKKSRNVSVRKKLRSSKSYVDPAMFQFEKSFLSYGKKSAKMKKGGGGHCITFFALFEKELMFGGHCITFFAVY